MVKGRVILYLLVWLVWAAAPAMAQQPVSDDEVNEVARNLYCPVCESTPLDVCPTQACADWRELIRQQLSQGKTKGEIFTYFANQYGDGVLAEPPRQGVNLILWLFPVVAVLIGGVYFVYYIRGLKLAPTADSQPMLAEPPAQGEDAPAPQKRPLAEYMAQVEAELME